MTERLEQAIADINRVKQAVVDTLGLHPLQILTDDHNSVPDGPFTFTGAQLMEYYEWLNHATTEIHLFAGHTFRIDATGKYGDPLDTFMPDTLLPEAESILSQAIEDSDDE